MSGEGEAEVREMSCKLEESFRLEIEIKRRPTRSRVTGLGEGLGEAQVPGIVGRHWEPAGFRHFLLGFLWRSPGTHSGQVQSQLVRPMARGEGTCKSYACECSAASQSRRILEREKHAARPDRCRGGKEEQGALSALPSPGRRAQASGFRVAAPMRG